VPGLEQFADAEASANTLSLAPKALFAVPACEEEWAGERPEKHTWFTPARNDKCS